MCDLCTHVTPKTQSWDLQEKPAYVTWVVIPRCGHIYHPQVVGDQLCCLSSQYPTMVPAADGTQLGVWFWMLQSRCRAVHLVSWGVYTVSLRGPVSGGYCWFGCY